MNSMSEELRLAVTRSRKAAQMQEACYDTTPEAEYARVLARIHERALQHKVSAEVTVLQKHQDEIVEALQTAGFEVFNTYSTNLKVPRARFCSILRVSWAR